jgi:hypothetical protein
MRVPSTMPNDTEARIARPEMDPLRVDNRRKSVLS